jgi:hypothetical protein
VVLLPGQARAAQEQQGAQVQQVGGVQVCVQRVVLKEYLSWDD